MIGHVGMGLNSGLRVVLGDEDDFTRRQDRFHGKMVVIIKQRTRSLESVVYYGLERLDGKNYRKVEHDIDENTLKKIR
ncbi:MAG: hypothetical protein CL678_15885 [Bdellovibrionaceae bacterium]|nr:hypothetical protein [Pseudobdellovibrionaceae bacterium]